jgi:hypothetical protein
MQPLQTTLAPTERRRFLGRLSGTPLGEKNLLAHSVYRPKHGLSSWIIDAHDEPRPQIADTPTVAFADGKYDPVNRVVFAQICPTRVETVKVSPVVS